jgi:A/G-specific adenine glycosylase
MTSFPTVHDLASASEEEVNAHWAGLGFYRRARLLHNGAQHVVETLNGQLPETVDELKQISGIGPYTACAIASIAFNVCVPVVDGNVCRVLSRLRGIANHIKSPALKDKLGWVLARQLVEAGDGKQAGLVNQALMELGATYCAPSGTGVDPKDPLRPFYWSTQLGKAYAVSRADNLSTGTYATANVNGRRKGASPVKNQYSTIEVGSAKECELCDRDGVRSVLAEWHVALSDDDATGEDKDMVAAQNGHAAFPLNPPKLKKREEDLAVAVLRRADCWLLVKRPKQGLLAGQWEFPSVCVQTRGETSSATNSTKPPSAQRHRQALTQLLKELFSCNDDSIDDLDLGGHPDYFARRESVSEAPIEHIFSHVKHIMWVEACCLGKGSKPEITEWETAENSRQVRWMREEDMKEVGITSGVQKIIKAVKGEQWREGKRIGASAGRKRKKT